MYGTSHGLPVLGLKLATIMVRCTPQRVSTPRDTLNSVISLRTWFAMSGLWARPFLNGTLCHQHQHLGNLRNVTLSFSFAAFSAFLEHHPRITNPPSGNVEPNITDRA